MKHFTEKLRQGPLLDRLVPNNFTKYSEWRWQDAVKEKSLVIATVVLVLTPPFSKINAPALLLLILCPMCMMNQSRYSVRVCHTPCAMLSLFCRLELKFTFVSRLYQSPFLVHILPSFIQLVSWEKFNNNHITTIMQIMLVGIGISGISHNFLKWWLILTRAIGIEGRN